jgi:hypothetical protein
VKWLYENIPIERMYITNVITDLMEVFEKGEFEEGKDAILSEIIDWLDDKYMKTQL